MQSNPFHGCYLSRYFCTSILVPHPLLFFPPRQSWKTAPIARAIWATMYPMIEENIVVVIMSRAHSSFHLIPTSTEARYGRDGWDKSRENKFVFLRMRASLKTIRDEFFSIANLNLHVSKIWIWGGGERPVICFKCQEFLLNSISYFQVANRIIEQIENTLCQITMTIICNKNFLKYAFRILYTPLQCFESAWH